MLLAAGLATAALGTLATFGPTSAGATKATPHEIVTAFNDGFADGRADATGDDNRDGRIDEDESGWDCRTMGNRKCGPTATALAAPLECRGAPADVLTLCRRVQGQPAYRYQPEGASAPIRVADGPALLATIAREGASPARVPELRELVTGLHVAFLINTGRVPSECAHAGTALRLCVTVAVRPAYGWTNPDGSRVDNPDGHAQVRGLDEKPGTPEFPAALRALDAEWREHH
ncbi:hypothetical protein [Streptomyces sp. ISL-100]|uniref:hypothetical protein n=1 Tax=Streptomyces sp. ISL-100 TaxID=2819173 RepID=UPI001BE932F7|nr:hypothetical protein [Streptomyces sp. ISL-100]MBT2396296.1 hypothetical protein [Streptomyces sp. ISL-100]